MPPTAQNGRGRLMPLLAPMIAAPVAVSAVDPEAELLKEQIRLLPKRVEELQKARAAAIFD